jgi:hypothetical protein
MIDPAVFRALVAQGATPEMLLAVVEADAAAEEAKRVTRRAKTAERVRKHRAKKATDDGDGNACNALQGVTERYSTEQKKLPPDPLKENYPLETSDEVPPPILFSEEPTGEPPLTAEEVLEAWNVTADKCGLPKARLTPQRRRKLGPLIRQHGIEDFGAALQAVERSPFLRGGNNRGWRADFDFFLQTSSFTKLIEGSYDGTN